MRKLLTIILSVLMVFFMGTMVACGNKGDNIESSHNNSSSNSSTENVKVSNIFLSKTELELGIGESFTLIATISPITANVDLQWSSSNETVATVIDGKVTAVSEGSVVIKVEEPNGLLSVCNVTVRIKTGKVTGDVSYKYNNYVGNKPDTGATIFLISKNVKTLPDKIGLGLSSNTEGVYRTEVDGSGKYTFDRIPVGK